MAENHEETKDKKEQQAEQQAEEMKESSYRWMGIGVEFCVVVMIFAWLGKKLDDFCGDTEPGFLIFGFFIGFIVMFYTMIKRAGGIKWK